MSSRTLTSRISKRSKQIPLRLVLVVPFVIEIFVAVGLTGWLSLRNGQKAVNDVATELRNEITARIQLQLQTFLTTPHLVNQINADAIRLGQLKIDNLQTFERHFWQQMHLFDSVSAISLGTATGEYIGVESSNNGTLRIAITDRTTKGDGYQYATDALGNRTQLVKINPNYDPRKRPWYIAAQQARKSTWSEIYPVFGEPKLTITASQPIYDNIGRLKGVVITDLIVSEIDEFLRSLKIGETGETFIIERSGMLVASSTLEQPFTMSKKGTIRRQASEMNDPLIRATTKHLKQLTEQLTQLDRNCQNINCTISTTFNLKGERQFVQITPLGGGRSGEGEKGKSSKLLNAGPTNKLFQDPPDWLIVVVIPEADFMAQIEANTRSTILLCTAALFIAILLGLLTSRWIVRPILRLNAAAVALSEGNWNQIVPVERQDELGMLAHTFNQMTGQLRLLYADLEANVVELMQAQKSLQRNEAKYRELVENANSIILRLDTEGNITFFNEFAQSFFGYTEAEIIGCKAIGTIIPQTDSAGSDLVAMLGDILQNPELYQLNENENIRRNGERVWVAWTTKALRDTKGNFTGILCIGSDISDRKRAENELHKERRYLAALVEVQSRLLAFQGNGNCYTEILEPLGQASRASRVYFFENHRDEANQLLTSQRAEWCAPEIEPEIDNPLLQNLSYNDFFPRWTEILSRGEAVAGNISEFPESERQILESQGILSLLILPLIVNGEFFGFIGFDNCQEAVIWQPSEVALLRAAAAAIALHKERLIAQDALQKAKENLEIRVLERTAQLRESEDRFRKLSEATFEGIVVGEGGKIADANEAFARMFGCESSEKIGADVLEYIAPENRAKVRQNMLAGNENPYEAIGLRKDGSRFPIEIQAKVIPYQGNQVRVVAIRDITERKQAEVALRESEEKFSTAFRQSPNSITISTFPDGHLIDVSDGFSDITQYSRLEVIGRTTESLNLWVNSEDRIQIQQQIQVLGSLRNQEVLFRKKSGEVIVGLLSAEIIYLGGVRCILTVTSDITERKRAQEALARALQEQQSIFEAQLDIIFVFDLNLNLVKWNHRTEVVTGLSPAELQNRPALAFFPESERDIIAQAIQLALEERSEGSWTEGHLIGKDGVLLDYQFTGVSLKDEKGNAIGFTGAGRDVTESNKAAAILRAEQENSERLLLNILPKAIAERLKLQVGPIAESFPESTVLFADIVGFTELSSQISPTELVNLLNQIFSRFDQLADRHDLEKIKTIGDAYMVVGGLPVPRVSHAEAIADMALDMQQEIRNFCLETNLSVNIRIGINSGPVVAGVIGLKKFIYDLWGDTVNTASRMESHGISGAIQVSATTYQLLQHKYQFENRGMISVKGKGEMITYLLLEKKATLV
ncbi:MAG: PAS domain S-box protein [Microcoleus vaginatus WJT46-NPBG5]|jgi:PAS domain S-box-containing protein|nr:PAS domain S-box protein [Microcoleus vaginatus WJT46-NPBG5]